MEEQRMTKEHEFRIRQLNIEKEMRKEEREHELKILQMLVAQPSSNVQLPSSNPFNMPVCSVPGFLASPSPIQLISQTANECSNTDYPIYQTSETPSTYFKL